MDHSLLSDSISIESEAAFSEFFLQIFVQALGIAETHPNWNSIWFCLIEWSRNLLPLSDHPGFRNYFRLSKDFRKMRGEAIFPFCDTAVLCFRILIVI
jgi:hypothetical protein